MITAVSNQGNILYEGACNKHKLMGKKDLRRGLLTSGFPAALCS